MSMTKVTISMKLQDPSTGYSELQVGAILRQLAERFEEGLDPTQVLDLKGNICGYINLVDMKEDAIKKEQKKREQELKAKEKEEKKKNGGK